MFLFNPMLADITIYGEALTVVRGGLFGVIFAAWLMAVVEKNVRKGVPASVVFIFISLIIVLVVWVLSLYAFMPVSGVISDGIIIAFAALTDTVCIVDG